MHGVRTIKGSSPLTRGKCPHGDDLQSRGRLIPAHAGKMPWRRAKSLRKRAHPRSRGENSQAALPRRTSKGSSPLTRGKSGGPNPARECEGLIPAHAGKIDPCAPGSSRRRAHPRSRGENTNVRKGLNALAGSSPLTRGKSDTLTQGDQQIRLIPAHAGKICRKLRRARAAAAHPRSRGENPSTGGETVGNNGSSPLTRGK